MPIGSIWAIYLIVLLVAVIFGPSLIAGIVLAIIFGVKKHKRAKETK